MCGRLVNINGVADALGIDPEPEMKEAWGRWQEQG